MIQAKVSNGLNFGYATIGEQATHSNSVGLVITKGKGIVTVELLEKHEQNLKVKLNMTNNQTH